MLPLHQGYIGHCSRSGVLQELQLYLELFPARQIGPTLAEFPRPHLGGAVAADDVGAHVNHVTTTPPRGNYFWEFSREISEWKLIPRS